MKLVLSDEAKKFLVKKGSNLDFGARPLRRAIENFVEDPLSEELLKGEFQGMDTITIEVKEVGDKKQLFFLGSVEQAAPARRRWPPARDGAADDPVHLGVGAARARFGPQPQYVPTSRTSRQSDVRCGRPYGVGRQQNCQCGSAHRPAWAIALEAPQDQSPRH